MRRLLYCFSIHTRISLRCAHLIYFLLPCTLPTFHFLGHAQHFSASPPREDGTHRISVVGTLLWREDVFLFLRPPTPHLLRVKQCQAADHATNENGQSTRSLQSIFTHNHHKASQPIATLRWSYHPYYFGDTSRLQQSHHHDETLHVIEEVILLFLSITQSTKLRLRFTEDNRYSSYQ